MTLARYFIAAMLGTSLGLTVADFGRPTGLKSTNFARWEAPKIEMAPAAAAVGDFGAGVMWLPPETLIKTTPKPRPPPVSVEPCDSRVQNRPGGWMRRVCN